MLHKAEWSNVIAIRYRGQRTRWPAVLLAQAERPPRTSILSMFASTPLPYYYSLVGKKVLNLGIRGLSFFLVLLDALVYFVRELQLAVDVASIRIIWVRTDLAVLRQKPHELFVVHEMTCDHVKGQPAVVANVLTPSQGLHHVVHQRALLKSFYKHKLYSLRFARVRVREISSRTTINLTLRHALWPRVRA